MLHVLEKPTIQYICVTCQRIFLSLKFFNLGVLIFYIMYMMIQFSMVLIRSLVL